MAAKGKIAPEGHTGSKRRCWRIQKHLLKAESTPKCTTSSKSHKPGSTKPTYLQKAFNMLEWPQKNKSAKGNKCKSKNGSNIGKWLQLVVKLSTKDQNNSKTSKWFQTARIGTNGQPQKNKSFNTTRWVPKSRRPRLVPTKTQRDQHLAQKATSRDPL